MIRTYVKLVIIRKERTCEKCNKLFSVKSKMYRFTVMPNGNKDCYNGPVDRPLTTYHCMECFDEICT